MTSIDDLRSTLIEAQSEGEALLQKLTDSDISRETANERWSVREHLVHLVVSEPGLCNTIRSALEDNWVVPEDFDLDRWNERQVERNKDLPLAELRQRFTVNRQGTLALLDLLSEADLTKQARHASLRIMPLAEFFQIIVDHQRQHLGEIETAISE